MINQLFKRAKNRSKFCPQSMCIQYLILGKMNMFKYILKHFLTKLSKLFTSIIGL
jgi:hypothetical protein